MLVREHSEYANKLMEKGPWNCENSEMGSREKCKGYKRIDKQAKPQILEFYYRITEKLGTHCRKPDR